MYWCACVEVGMYTRMPIRVYTRMSCTQKVQATEWAEGTPQGQGSRSSSAGTTGLSRVLVFSSLRDFDDHVETAAARTHTRGGVVEDVSVAKQMLREYRWTLKHLVPSLLQVC